MTEPIDEAHRISLTMLRVIREAFDAKREEVSVWEPAPYPEPVPEPEQFEEELEVTTWERPRPWFRT
jgi:hypothetical protein